MKIVLASLMCLLLGASQSFAHKGGPTYPAGTNIGGSYAGVLQGVFDPTNPASSNSIGIFSLKVPSTGNATGTFVMFSRGRVFTGTAQAFADPNKSSLKGVLEATYNFNLLVPVSTVSSTGIVVTTISSVPVTASANGPINATVAQSKSANLFSTATTIVSGDATLSISQGEVAANGDPVITSILSLVVSGVKQSDSLF
ncbi:MAG: hypothetical protein ACXV8A_01605 [Chthoniobacterales bacterium]